MKNKKGFTLIEVVAVIFIISVIMLLVIPKIVNSVKGKQTEVSDTFKEMLYSAADLYYKENEEIYPVTTDATYCVTLEELVKDGKIVEPVKDVKTNKQIPLNRMVKATANSYNQFDYELVDKCTSQNGGTFSLILLTPNVLENKIEIPYSINSTNSIKKVTCEYGETSSYGSTGTITDNKCILSDLKNNTKYYYKIKVVDSKDNEKYKTGYKSTSQTSSCSITVSDENSWTSSKTVTIEKTGTGTLEYMIKNNNTVKQDWTSYTNPLNINYSSTESTPTEVSCRIKDGSSVIDTASKSIVNVDTSKPILDIESKEILSNKITINLKTKKDDESGIKVTNAYYGTSTSYGSNAGVSGNVITMSNLSADTTYYYKITLENNAGLVTELTGSTKTAGGVTNFAYTGGIQTYKSLRNCTYKLETWGAQGDVVASTAYGGYSVGKTNINKDTTIYVVVGQKGQYSGVGGYNGGGTGSGNNDSTYGYSTGGGGATHIASVSGTLSSIGVNQISKIYIVAGAGGGHSGYQNNGTGGHAGGYIGNNAISTSNTPATGGTQSSAGSGYVYSNGSFGMGGSILNSDHSAGGGGGGLYGGGCGANGGGAGGSSYIGNSLLTDKAMYCYNCTTSSSTATKTVSVTCASATPTVNCAKAGDGYARITIESCTE